MLVLSSRVPANLAACARISLSKSTNGSFLVKTSSRCLFCFSCPIPHIAWIRANLGRLASVTVLSISSKRSRFANSNCASNLIL